MNGAAVLVERDGAVAVVTLNRPERRNTLDGKTKTALRGALEDVAADGSVRAVLLTGAGGTFCAGQTQTHLRGPLTTPSPAR